jgi:uncharacterized protein YkwD/ribosomal protein L37AE/L43A
MYWGQVALSLIAAMVTAGFLYLRGRSPLVVMLIAIIIYFTVRWFIAWGFRIRYWYRRGTKGIYSTSCPNCGQYIYRRRRHWILQCERCGWKAGLPFVRWITQSVPARQFRRTVVGPQLIVVIVAIGILVLGGITGAITGLNPAGSAANNTDGSVLINLSASNLSVSVSSQNTSTPGPEVQEGYNRTLVELHFIKLLNEERSSRGLQNVSRSAVLREMGKEHSEDMAEHDYIGHTDSDGRTIRDRYEERGLLPKCKLPIKGSNRYYPGAENAAGAWVERRFTSAGGSYFVSNEQELAEALFSIWMNSPPHRRAMLVYSADKVGLGITITEGGKVYAALELC